MDSTLNINQTVSEIKKLDYRDKINIISMIINLLKQEDKAHQIPSVTDLKGLGKKIWKNTDIDSYIAAER